MCVWGEYPLGSESARKMYHMPCVVSDITTAAYGVDTCPVFDLLVRARISKGGRARHARVE
jgi:hypothetical protein